MNKTTITKIKNNAIVIISIETNLFLNDIVIIELKQKIQDILNQID